MKYFSHGKCIYLLPDTTLLVCGCASGDLHVARSLTDPGRFAGSSMFIDQETPEYYLDFWDDEDSYDFYPAETHNWLPIVQYNEIDTHLFDDMSSNSELWQFGAHCGPGGTMEWNETMTATFLNADDNTPGFLEEPRRVYGPDAAVWSAPTRISKPFMPVYAGGSRGKAPKTCGTFSSDHAFGPPIPCRGARQTRHLRGRTSRESFGPRPPA